MIDVIVAVVLSMVMLVVLAEVFLWVCLLIQRCKMHFNPNPTFHHFTGMQLGLLTFVAVLFSFSWDKMKGETKDETNGQQQNQQRVMSENDQLNYQQLPSGGSIQ